MALLLLLLLLSLLASASVVSLASKTSLTFDVAALVGAGNKTRYDPVALVIPRRGQPHRTIWSPRRLNVSRRPKDF
jgi:hypothetical protein